MAVLSARLTAGAAINFDLVSEEAGHAARRASAASWSSS